MKEKVEEGEDFEENRIDNIPMYIYYANTSKLYFKLMIKSVY